LSTISESIRRPTGQCRVEPSRSGTSSAPWWRLLDHDAIYGGHSLYRLAGTEGTRLLTAFRGSRRISLVRGRLRRGSTTGRSITHLGDARVLVAVQFVCEVVHLQIPDPISAFASIACRVTDERFFRRSFRPLRRGGGAALKSLVRRCPPERSKRTKGQLPVAGHTIPGNIWGVLASRKAKGYIRTNTTRHEENGSADYDRTVKCSAGADTG